MLYYSKQIHVVYQNIPTFIDTSELMVELKTVLLNFH